jgi:hypothetical protein
MARMRFEIRRDIDTLVTDISRRLADDVHPNYALGYLRYTLVDALMQLPPRKRDFEVRLLEKALAHENEKKVA